MPDSLLTDSGQQTLSRDAPLNGEATTVRGLTAAQDAVPEGGYSHARSRYAHPPLIAPVSRVRVPEARPAGLIAARPQLPVTASRMRVYLRNALLAGLVACLAAALAACGQSDSQTQTSGGSSGSQSHSGHHGGMHMHGDSGTNMTPAYAVDGDLRTGSFRPLSEASKAAVRINGDAWVAENGNGTTVTADLAGLEVRADYAGHLHARPCSHDDGGPHFAFDPEGPEAPPNEVHFGFTADHHGGGTVGVHNPRRVGSGARSVVVHDAKSENRLVCADLRPATRTQVQHATETAGSSAPSADALTVDVEIDDGEVTPAGDRVEAKAGQPIRLNVSSDQADEIHVHSTPEHEFAVTPGNGHMFAFTINRPGVYEVESHETDTVIVSVAVTP